MNASYYDHFDAARIILKVESIDISLKNNDGYTAFMFACACGYAEIAKLLLLAASKKVSNFSINDMNNYNSTALLNASMNGRIEVLKLLLADPRIDLDVKDRLGNTALELFVKHANNLSVQEEEEGKVLFQGELLPFQLQLPCSFNRPTTHPLSLFLSLSLCSHSCTL